MAFEQIIATQNKELDECKCEIKALKEEIQIQKMLVRETSINMTQIKESLIDFKAQQQKANENLLLEIQNLKGNPGKLWNALMFGGIGAAGVALVNWFIKK